MACYPNCNNHPKEERVGCDTEREHFDLNILVDQKIEKMKTWYFRCRKFNSIRTSDMKIGRKTYFC